MHAAAAPELFAAPTSLALNDAARPSDPTVAILLEKIDRPAAVLDADGSVHFGNVAFERVLRSGESSNPQNLTAVFKNLIAAAKAEGKAHQQTSLFNGHLVQATTCRLGEDYLVTLDQLAEQSIAAPATNLIDPLTRPGNREMLSAGLKAMLESGGSPQDEMAVLRLDLDRFKAVNDSLGNAIGDALLRVVADRIRQAIGQDDIAVRLDGDEFVIIQVHQQQPQASTALASRIIDLLGRAYLLGGNLINIGVSIGIAVTNSAAEDEKEVLKHAELALNRAKNKRGVFCFFEPAMNEEVQARRSLEIDLRRALALREFALVYQPQVSLKSGTVTGFEALLRWHHPQRGLVSPAQFIPLAEDIGLIVPIGEWVIRTACREAASWSQKHNIAVNVSAVQFKSLDLVTTVVSALAESGLEPTRLELEVTESVLIGDHKAALDVLTKVREMGVRVSMDDFGTGYSSLSYLRSFPFDKIKIDQSFVRENPENSSGMAIVHAIAALGKSLGMTTTAEGVETEEQMERIAADGCTDVQGYLISRPLPPDQIDNFLDSYQTKKDNLP